MGLCCFFTLKVLNRRLSAFSLVAEADENGRVHFTDRRQDPFLASGAGQAVRQSGRLETSVEGKCLSDAVSQPTTGLRKVTAGRTGLPALPLRCERREDIKS